MGFVGGRDFAHCLIRRRSVSSLTGKPKRLLSRSPGRPPRAYAICCTTSPEALGFSRMPMADARQALAEDLSLTARIATAPAADAQLQVDGPPLHGEVFQMPHVAAVARG